MPNYFTDCIIGATGWCSWLDGMEWADEKGLVGRLRTPKDTLAHFTGKVERDDPASPLVFSNDNGAIGQRLTTVALGGDPSKNELDLTPYQDKYIRVEGTEANDWILEAQILESSDEPFADAPSAAE